jgi:hypothetical protein
MCSRPVSLHTINYIALQMHCTENSKQIFPEMKLRAPNFYIHVSECNLYIPTISPQTQYAAKEADKSWEYINRGQKLGTKPRSFISGNIIFRIFDAVWNSNIFYVRKRSYCCINVLVNCTVYKNKKCRENYLL